MEFLSISSSLIFLIIFKRATTFNISILSNLWTIRHTHIHYRRVQCALWIWDSRNKCSSLFDGNDFDESSILAHKIWIAHWIQYSHHKLILIIGHSAGTKKYSQNMLKIVNTAINAATPQGRASQFYCSFNCFIIFYKISLYRRIHWTPFSIDVCVIFVLNMS